MTSRAGRPSDRIIVRVARIVLPGVQVRATDAAAARAGFLLELRAPDGRSGWGEASPLPGYAQETPERAAAALLALAASGTARTALAEVFRDPAAVVTPLAAGAHPGTAASGPDALSGLLAAPLPPSARAALVSALFDLAGRVAGRPVRALLGARGAGTEGLASVSLNALVPLGEPETAAAAARDAVARGISTLKAKLGPAERAEADLAALRAIRAAVGPGVAIRLDGNGLWSTAEARRLLPTLAAEIGPEYVEEPVPPDELAGFLDAPVPLAADESLRDPARADRLLESGALAAVVLKPGPFGGLDRCVALARRAAERGVPAVVTHAFEGPVGHAAACELALALHNGAAPGSGRDVGPACGLDVHAALAVRPEVAVPQLRAAAVVPAAVSGLGVDPAPLLAPPGAEPRESA